MSKQFDEQTQGLHPIGAAAGVLMDAAAALDMPIVLPMYAQGNALALQPGELRGRVAGDHSVHPDCDGIVLAIPCNQQEATAIMAWLHAWQSQRLKAKAPKSRPISYQRST